MTAFDDKYKFKRSSIQLRMQLRSDICKHYESWSVDSHQRIKDAFAELHETSTAKDRHEPSKSQLPPPMEWTRKPLKK
ncbi:MAG: hypothetical protein GYA24_01830 [Candidatus Lokiarchaeota archaeon]|nr:hypothetical protein [Candidatus Lokiarchaeota archaeon]